MKKIFRRAWIFSCCPTVAVFAAAPAPISDFDGIIPSTYIPEAADNLAGDKIVNSLAKRVQTGELELQDVFLFILKLIDLVSKLAGTIAVIVLLYAGIQFMISGATDEKEKAKTTLKFAIIGMVVTFGAWLAVNLILVQLGGPNAALG